MPIKYGNNGGLTVLPVDGSAQIVDLTNVGPSTVESAASVDYLLVSVQYTSIRRAVSSR
jgi:hypothetical protein